MVVIENARLRKALAVVIACVLIPLTVVGGSVVLRSKNYSFVILAVALLSLVLFICGFDKRKTGTRRLVLTAAFIALASAGRALLAFIPGVNPITAITVFAAIYLGSEAGFMVGAYSALISNMFAGQGVWSAFQMFAWGMIGLAAGLLAKKLEGHTVRICIYCFTAGIVYSLIMDVWTVLWAYNSFNLEFYLASITTALPFTAIYAFSNAAFAWVMAKPFSEKLGRIKTKYSI